MVNNARIDTRISDISESAPYNIGDILDVRRECTKLEKGFPDRVLILGKYVYGTVLMYQAQYESTGEQTALDATSLTNMLSGRHKRRPANVYSNPVIVDRYASGWRWVCNGDYHDAVGVAEYMKTCDRIKRVRICEAYGPNGSLSDKSSVWIRYENPINGTGAGTDTAKGKIMYPIDIK